MAVTRVGPPLINPDGTYTYFFSDGSMQLWSADHSQMISSQGPDPNRAALFQVGDPEAIKAEKDRQNDIWAQREQRLYDYNERAYADTRGDRLADVSYRQQSADRQYDLSNRQFGLSEKQFGLSQQQFEQQVRQADREWEMSQRRQGNDDTRLGLSILDSAIRAGEQPEDWVRLNRYNQGVKDMPLFLQNMQNGGSATSSFNQPGDGGPAPQQNTLGKILANMQKSGEFTPQQIASMALIGGQGFSDSPGRDDQDNALLASVVNMADMGGHRYSEKWDTLGKDTQGMILGGMKSVGRSPTAWLEQVNKGRLVQGSPLAA